MHDYLHPSESGRSLSMNDRFSRNPVNIPTPAEEKVFAVRCYKRIAFMRGGIDSLGERFPLAPVPAFFFEGDIQVRSLASGISS